MRNINRLRNNLIRNGDNGIEILLANFELSKQKTDIQKRTAVIENFLRTKIDVKPFEDENFNWANEEKIMEAMATGFDMPSWALYALEGIRELDERLKPYTEVFIYQLKGCNLQCQYCFVDDSNKDGKINNGARYFSIVEIVDEFEDENERRQSEGRLPLRRIRASGGEPTLIVEQWIQLLEELEKRKLTNKIHLQSDTNLTTGHFINELMEKGELDKNIFYKIAEYKNFGLLCSFKGTDRINFQENTGIHPRFFDEQIYSFKKLTKSGINAYPFFYNPNPDSLEIFLNKLANEVSEEIYLKSWIFPLKVYEPVRERLGGKSLLYEREWKENFEKAEEKMREILQKKFGLEYKKSLRVKSDRI